MKAYDIKWDIDVEDAYDKLDDMTSEKAAEALDLPKEKYANMTTSERHDYAYDAFHHNKVDLAEFMGLPDEVEIPKSVGTNDEDISDWLSDQYGYCHDGFALDTD